MFILLGIKNAFKGFLGGVLRRVRTHPQNERRLPRPWKPKARPRNDVVGMRLPWFYMPLLLIGCFCLSLRATERSVAIAFMVFYVFKESIEGVFSPVRIMSLRGGNVLLPTWQSRLHPSPSLRGTERSEVTKQSQHFVFYAFGGSIEGGPFYPLQSMAIASLRSQWLVEWYSDCHVRTNRLLAMTK